MNIMFLPPYGDCTKIVNAIEKAMTLSSPYGDGIQKDNVY